MIYYGKQSISQEDIDAVVNVLKSEFITQGPQAKSFESSMCKYTGASYALACSHGTAALHLACLALDIGCGDIVWTSPNSFVASANCALYCGADIDLVDIDSDSLNLSVEQLSEKLEISKRNNTLPKALIIVHFAGNPCDMEAIKKLSELYSFFIIEDASHALGASYQDHKVGKCVYSDITTFSFHPVKSITSGEGGMLLTNSIELAEKARLYATHGITRDKSALENQHEGEWFYEQQLLGFNYRITDIQAALGLSQLKRLDTFIEKRKSISDYYESQLSGLPIISTQVIKQEVMSAYHLYPISIADCDIKRKMDVFGMMKANGVMCNCHYIPIHLQPYYQRKGFRIGDFPNAEKYYASSLSLPIYPDLSELDQKHVIASLNKCF